MFKVRINMGDIAEKVKQGIGEGQMVLDQQVLKDSNYYIPKDQGYLEQSAILNSKIGEGEIIWRTPYARRLYYNPQYNFSTDRNPNARGLWFEEAKAAKRKEWIDLAEKAARKKI